MKWIKNDLDQTKIRSLAAKFKLDLLSASILARRNLTEADQVALFLSDDPALLRNPFLFDAMEDAVDRILLAAEEEEKVLVFGDSDADGVTSTTLMVEALASMGIKASWKVPRGEEPYGLSLAAVEAFAAEGGGLIITVDCGISCHEEVARASELGVDTIICDHHRLQTARPPEALAVLDPKIPDCGYPFRDLAGAGVALKLAQALAFSRTMLYKQPLALLSFTRLPGDPEQGKGAGILVEAVRLHNLVETARFSEVLGGTNPDPDTRPAERGDSFVARLERFLRGRAILVRGKREQLKLAREIFGPGVELECRDILDGISPEQAASIDERSSISADGAPSDLDRLFGLLDAVARGPASLGEETDSYFQLAALGTIADLMPLQDENRIIVKRGLAGLANQPRKGLAELLSTVSPGRKLGSNDIAWQVTPLLNAAGRVGTPEIALSLLMADSPAERAKAIADIQAANEARKRLGTEVWETVYPEAGLRFESCGKRYVLIGSPRIRSGITGLLASRIVNVFKVPAIVAAFKEDGTVTASVRTANDFRISGLLEECAEFFIDYGGHDAAAGFSLPMDRWEAFAEKADSYLKNADINVKEESLLIDAELPHSYLRPELQDLAAKFEPYGEGNPPIVFLARDVSVVDAQIVGKSAKTHLKLTLDFGKYKWPALLWDGSARLERDFSFRNRDRIDIVFKVTVNRWNGEERPQLELFDLRRSGGGSID